MGELLGTAIPLLLSNFTVTFFVLGLLVAVLIIATKRPGRHEVWQILLSWFHFFAIGVTYIFNGIMHTVFSDLSASLIGWENNGFQLEVGFASIGIGIVGLMAFPRHMPLVLKLAALVGPACFLWGAAGTHIVDIVTTGNLSSHNAGPVLYTDILMPIVGLVLWGFAVATRPKAERETDAAAA